MKRRPEIADELFDERFCHAIVISVDMLREGRLVVFREHSHLGSCLFESDAILKSRGHVEKARSVLYLFGRDILRLEHAWHENHHGVEWLAESRRQNADDCVRSAAQDNGFANGRVAPAKVALPAFIAEYCNIRAADGVLLFGEISSAEWHDPQRREKAGRDLKRIELLGIGPVGRERVAGKSRRGDV